MKKQALSLMIDKDLADWIRQQASNENRSINNWIETKLFEVKKQSDDEDFDS